MKLRVLVELIDQNDCRMAGEIWTRRWVQLSATRIVFEYVPKGVEITGLHFTYQGRFLVAPCKVRGLGGSITFELPGGAKTMADVVGRFNN